MAQNVRSTRRTQFDAKVKRTLSSGQVHVFASFNNTIVTVTDHAGQYRLLGQRWFGWLQGLAARALPLRPAWRPNRPSRLPMSMGIQEVDLIVKGPGPGRESAIRAVQSLGLKVRSISDVTPVPHNGCRPPKKRRV